MIESQAKPRVAIVDFGLGNLFSVRQACMAVNMEAIVTSSPEDVLAADALILPGVGAFADAMQVLRERELDTAIKNVAASGRLVVGVCLGMQLLMTESEEFGRHGGLDLLAGRVTRLPEGMRWPGGRRAKVPAICWNEIRAASNGGGTDDVPELWKGTPLEDTPDGTRFYFVHSFAVTPDAKADQLATTIYGERSYCSSVRRKNVIGLQFHPERSGPAGLAIYASIARLVTAGAAAGEAGA